MDLVYGVSTITDGNMSEKVGDQRGVVDNRRRFLSKMGLRYEDCVLAWLQHGVEMAEVRREDAGEYFKVDALLTREVGVGLFMVTADCLPVIVYDQERGQVALVHLGYQGVGKKLVQKVVGRFTDPATAKVIIGPGVRRESYVFEGVMQKDDPGWQPFLEKLVDGRTAVDLVGFIKKQLVDVGIRDVEDCGVDTVKDLNYFSHYRAVRTGEPEGRFATVVMMK